MLKTESIQRPGGIEILHAPESISDRRRCMTRVMPGLLALVALVAGGCARISPTMMEVDIYSIISKEIPVGSSLPEVREKVKNLNLTIDERKNPKAVDPLRSDEALFLLTYMESEANIFVLTSYWGMLISSLMRMN